MKTSELVSKIGHVKNMQAQAYKSYKELKETEEVLKAELFAQLRELGTKSFKGEEYTVSIAEKLNIVITNERDVIEWLEHTPNVESDFYIGVKKPEFQTLARQMLKETGEMAHGTELETKESLSIRENKRG